MINILKIALAQFNPVLGDIDGNTVKARQARKQAQNLGADLILFSELYICAYPPEDLVLKPSFQEACRKACENLAKDTKDGGPAMLVGLPWKENGKLYNAVALLNNGVIETTRFKVDLPNYSVFDEKRVFDSGAFPSPISFKGVRIGVPICEDIWGQDVVECLSESGAEILLVPNGSPYTQDKTDTRLNVAVARVTEAKVPLIYLNQVGGQDELVFDGASFGLNADCSLAFQMPAFQEAITLVTLNREEQGWCIAQGKKHVIEQDDKADYTACVLGLRDYVIKNGFKSVVLGLSGGIDSALCAAMAVDALGADKVHCVMLPYRYTSRNSLDDALNCAKALGVRYDILPIESAVSGFETLLKPLFKDTQSGLTEENLQSRTRGTTLMSISNKFGAMVLTTGNKSEMSVGYATLYGDMNGGFNPLKDLYKLQVFRLCELRNRWKPNGGLGPDGLVIPTNIITKPPTAELRENQKDQDSLPPYEILDAILERLVEQEMRVDEIVAEGFELETVKKVERLLYLAEYKRRQAAPGVKVTLKSFGRDRRYPIVNRFRDASD